MCGSWGILDHVYRISEMDREIIVIILQVSRLLLLAGADPDHTTDLLGNAPALCVFAHEGSQEMVALLLEFGASVHTKNSQGCTALILASTRGHLHIVSQIIGAGASLGAMDTAGR